MDLEEKYEKVINPNRGYYESESEKSERLQGRAIAFVGVCMVESAKIIADALTKRGLPQASVPDDRG